MCLILDMAPPCMCLNCNPIRLEMASAPLVRDADKNVGAAASRSLRREALTEPEAGPDAQFVFSATACK